MNTKVVSHYPPRDNCYEVESTNFFVQFLIELFELFGFRRKS
jgi:hypothetical protein